MRILVTNDDSHRSPLLKLLLDLIAPLGEVRLVLPQHERSWSGKSMTRFGAVLATSGEVAGYPAWFISGTPADCVNLGIYTLWRDRPDLVVSGINAGLNAGLGFLWSSGTVGGAIEANLAGVPALAVSQAFDPATMSRYSGSYAIDESTCSRFACQYRKFLPGLLERLIARRAEARACDAVVWNMNFPSEVTENAELRAAQIGETRYSRAFAEELSENNGTTRVFHHRAELVRCNDGIETDVGILQSGHVSLTPILLRGIDGARDRQSIDFCRTLCEFAPAP